MPAWYWELHGWELLTATISIVAAMVGAVVGLVWALGKGLTRLLSPHDWRTCRCRSCRDKLFEARRKRGDRVIGFTPNGVEIWDTKRTDAWEPGPHKQSDWLSTVELRPGDVVGHGDYVYRVREVRVDQKGYAVGVENQRNRNLAVINITFANAPLKLWKPYKRGPE